MWIMRSMVNFFPRSDSFCSGLPLHYVRFYWHFLENIVMRICSMLQVCIIAIWSQDPILNSERLYSTFGTKIPVFRANSVFLLGTKWWIYKNVSRIVKIVHSEMPRSILSNNTIYYIFLFMEVKKWKYNFRKAKAFFFIITKLFLGFCNVKKPFWWPN